MNGRRPLRNKAPCPIHSVSYAEWVGQNSTQPNCSSRATLSEANEESKDLRLLFSPHSHSDTPYFFFPGNIPISFPISPGLAA
jgi:hypothetical protein